MGILSATRLIEAQCAGRLDFHLLLRVLYNVHCTVFNNVHCASYNVHCTILGVMVVRVRTYELRLGVSVRVRLTICHKICMGLLY